MLSSSLAVCHFEDVNVTVHRCLHNIGDHVYVNYTIQRSVMEFIPLTVEIHQGGEMIRTFRCTDGSLPDSLGMKIVTVVFKEECTDPTIIINRLLTIYINLELEVTLSHGDKQCNNITVGPQREYTSAQ